MFLFNPGQGSDQLQNPPLITVVWQFCLFQESDDEGDVIIESENEELDSGYVLQCDLWSAHCEHQA